MIFELEQVINNTIKDKWQYNKKGQIQAEPHLATTSELRPPRHKDDFPQVSKMNFQRLVSLEVRELR